jgi:hypothetical protein
MSMLSLASFASSIHAECDAFNFFYHVLELRDPFHGMGAVHQAMLCRMWTFTKRKCLHFFGTQSTSKIYVLLGEFKRTHEKTLQ